MSRRKGEWKVIERDTVTEILWVNHNKSCQEMKLTIKWWRGKKLTSPQLEHSTLTMDSELDHFRYGFSDRVGGTAEVPPSIRGLCLLEDEWAIGGLGGPDAIYNHRLKVSRCLTCERFQLHNDIYCMNAFTAYTVLSTICSCNSPGAFIHVSTGLGCPRALQSSTTVDPTRAVPPAGSTTHFGDTCITNQPRL